MTLPSPQESASMLVAAIKRHIPHSHQAQAEILLAVAQHIEADRAAHCRHVMTMPPGEIIKNYYHDLPTAHPTHGAATPGRAGGALKKGTK
jgi:hypothetical protein